MKGSILDIVYYPQNEGMLRQYSEAIVTFNREIGHLAKVMLNTMRHHKGVGLAGVQVGVLQRIFVMDIPEQKSLPNVFINPKIIEATEETMTHEEGCLSIPEYHEKITRSKKIKLAAQNEKGDPFEIELEGLAAICAQHEIDHLNGKLFIDYLSSLKRQRLHKKMSKKR